jgi:16S rRNA (guanine527-N7)-methyltransferase
MEKRDFLRTLLALTDECGIPFCEEQALMCHQHIALMLEWNHHYNLTRIMDFGQIMEKHLLDSLIPARWLPRAGPAIDIGSGPGFPGIPLKILHPQLEMLLLESHRKKASFLKVALARLPLHNISALHGRWEKLTKTDHPLLKNPFKLAIMRAVRLEPEHLAIAASEILGREGVFAWWAGPSSDLTRCDQHGGLLEDSEMTFDGRYSYALPSASRPRYLYIWRKKAVGRKEPGALTSQE